MVAVEGLFAFGVDRLANSNPWTNSSRLSPKLFSCALSEAVAFGGSNWILIPNEGMEDILLFIK